MLVFMLVLGDGLGSLILVGIWGGGWEGILGWFVWAASSLFLKWFKLSSKFLLFLLAGGGSGGSKGNSRVVIFGRGGGNFFFFLVDFCRPSCLIRVSWVPILTKIFWPKCGWGFFFLIVLIFGGDSFFWPKGGWGVFLLAVDFGGGIFFWGEVNVLGVVILGIFLGEGFSESWQIFLLGVHILGGGGIFFLEILADFSSGVYLLFLGAQEYHLS